MFYRAVISKHFLIFSFNFNYFRIYSRLLPKKGILINFILKNRKAQTLSDESSNHLVRQKTTYIQNPKNVCIFTAKSHLMVKITDIINTKSRKIDIRSTYDYVKLSRAGLTSNELRKILKYTGITAKKMASILSISERQISRYENEKILKKDMSAQLIQIANLYIRGYKLFEEEGKFQGWMKSEIRGLAYEKPIDLLDTAFGIELVYDELGRLEHGIIG